MHRAEVINGSSLSLRLSQQTLVTTLAHLCPERFVKDLPTGFASKLHSDFQNIHFFSAGWSDEGCQEAIQNSQQTGKWQSLLNIFLSVCLFCHSFFPAWCIDAICLKMLLPCSEYSHLFRKAVYFRDINGWDKLALLRRLVSRGYWTSSKKKFCLSPHIRIWGDFEVQVFFPIF